MTIRLTLPTRAVLDVLLEAPLWGYQIIPETDLGPGTVYPILKRLQEEGWIEGTWEEDVPPDRPRRCTYALTEKGVREYAEALARRSAARRRLQEPDDE
jgi:PadR family transcriptional regulator PadR